MTDRTLYYVVSVANSGRVSLRWSAAFATAPEARAYLKAKVDAGDATLGTVVRFRGGAKEPFETDVYPAWAGKVVRHWLDICDACEESAHERPPENQ